MFLPNWRYGGNDPGLRLFTLANPKLPALESGDVFEVGARDTDWLERAAAANPELTVSGIDWRDDARANVAKGDVLTWDHHSDFNYGAIVSLSAIEHIGLGHYEHDPIDVYGDVKAVQRLRDWLRHDGFLYFDVPYAPEGYVVHGTKCRIYDDRALRERFGPHEVLGYTTQSVDGWIDKPTRNCTAHKPYYYVALLVRKEHGTQ